jgi:hypothetical protein
MIKMIRKVINKIKEFLFVPKVRIRKFSNTLIFTDKEIKKMNAEIKKHLQEQSTTYTIGDYIYNWYKE